MATTEKTNRAVERLAETMRDSDLAYAPFDYYKDGLQAARRATG